MVDDLRKAGFLQNAHAHEKESIARSLVRAAQVAVKLTNEGRV
jgi:hypothetical protein